MLRGYPQVRTRKWPLLGNPGTYPSIPAQGVLGYISGDDRFGDTQGYTRV